MTESPDRNLTSDTLRGLSWVYSGSALATCMQLAYTAVMGRLLDPSEFGLLAMALVFERFGNYFARMGVNQALIQKPNLDQEDIRVAVTGTLGLGLVFGISLAVGAPLARMLFGTAAVVPVIRLMAVAFFIGSIAQVSTGLLRRSLRFRALTAIDLATQGVSSLVVGVTLALLGFGVWSLVGARVAQSVLQTSLSYAATRHAARPLFDWARARELYGYGGRVSVISFFEFLGSSLDVLLIGRFAGSARLGQYNRAHLLVNLPFQQIVGGFGRVVFPSFSRIQADRTRLRAAYRSAYWTLAGLLVPTAAGLALAAPEAVRVVIGPQWGPAAEVLPALALAAAVSFLSMIGGIVCDATAALNRKLILQLIHVTLLAALLIAARQLGTLLAFAMAVLAAELTRHFMYMLLMRSVLGFGIAAHARLLAPVLLGTGCVALAVGAVSALLRPVQPAAATLAAQGVAGFLTLTLCLWWGPMAGIRRDATARLDAAGVLSSDRWPQRAARSLLTRGR